MVVENKQNLLGVGGIGDSIKSKMRKLSDCRLPEELSSFTAAPTASDKVPAKSFEGSPKPPATWKLTLSQVFLGILVNLGSMSAGANLGYSAVALPVMRRENSTMTITDEEASWIAGVASLSTPLGCLLSGWLLDRWGRRSALLWQNLPALLGWILIALPGYVPGGLSRVYTGRLLTGLATGMGSVPGTVYVAEVGVKKLRGMLATWTSIAISIGILIVYIVGAAVPNWRLVAAICAVIPVVAGLLVFFLVTESPVWLVAHGYAPEAQRALMRLRLTKDPEMVREELEDLVRDHQKARSRHNDTRGVRDLLRDLGRPECWKPLVIMNLFFFFQQFSGVFVVISYSVDIIVEAGIDSDPYIFTVLIGVSRLIVTLAAGFLSTRFGRRPLAISSGVGMTVCMLGLATHVLLAADGRAPAGPWLPVTALVVFILTSTLGFLTLPWAMVGEVFPSRIRGAAGGFTTCMAYVCCFIIIKVYPSMAHSMAQYGAFFFFGAVSLFGLVFVAVFLPETQGRTLQEVEDYFAGRARRKIVLAPEAVEAAEMKTLTKKSNAVVVPVKSVNS